METRGYRSHCLSDDDCKSMAVAVCDPDTRHRRNAQCLACAVPMTFNWTPRSIVWGEGGGGHSAWGALLNVPQTCRTRQCRTRGAPGRALTKTRDGHGAAPRVHRQDCDAPKQIFTRWTSLYGFTVYRHANPRGLARSVHPPAPQKVLPNKCMHQTVDQGGASRSQSAPHMHVLVCICSNVRQFHTIIGMIQMCYHTIVCT